MNILRQISISLILSFFSLSLLSQGDGVGQWTDHLPFNSFIAVTETPDKIYGASPYAVLTYDKEEQSIEQFTKISGLSDIGIADIKYSEGLQTVVVAYTNTNLDLFKGNTIVNVPDIKRKPILGNKVINRVTIRNDYAYLSCGFGIVVLDVRNEEIFDTWYIGPQGSQVNVYDLAYNDTSFFAATEDGIFHARLDHPNLADFSAWKKMVEIPQKNSAYNIIENFSGRIFVNLMADSQGEQDSLFYYDGDKWFPFLSTNQMPVHSLSAGGGKLIVALAYKGYVFNGALEEELEIYTYNPGDAHMNDAILGSDGSIWVADDRAGLVRSFGGGFGSEKINPGGPYSVNVLSMTPSGNRVWVAPGGFNSTWAPVFLNDGIYKYENFEWVNYGPGTHAYMGNVRDVVTIAVNPANANQVYLGAYRKPIALIEFTDAEVTNEFNEENSELQLWEAAGRVALVGLDYDSQGSLWALCSGAEKLLAEKKSNGTWASYNLGGSASAVDCRKLFVDSYDQKWILFRHTNSNPNYIAVYYERNAPGDRLKLLRSEAGLGNIPGSNVFSIAQDLDGEIWIGTDQGIGIFYSPTTILTGTDYDAVRPLVNFDGYVQYLLETEVVTAIAVDGDNRKWIGTERSGVFLLSPDGTEQIAHFTENNSPLFSDQVIDISINDNGEVFIATASGIIGYRGTASASNEEYSDVYAYPNPVKDGYDGWIAVKGLIQDSDIKITDINGTLVYATRSQGGQAVWNGKNFDGRKAKPGVYLVFAATEDGAEKVVTKILIID